MSDQSADTMTDRIAALELALQQVAAAKKQLCRNTAEAKSLIQCSISRQLEALRNREVWLLNQLDVVTSAKEEVLQQQTARLNKTLGVVQSSAAHSRDTDTFPWLDLGDLAPEETPHVSFRAEPASLRECIMSYGRIDAISGRQVQSPFMAPDQPAPSLPRHFEDYEDVEHHVLYKTVEEVNRKKTEESCVYVNIPKLSSRLEDWLLHPPTTTTMSASEPRFSFPPLSSNMSDWLRGPGTSCREGVAAGHGRSPPLVEGLATGDASIKTWLHKIKQCPHEEEDYDFIDEMSDTHTQASQDLEPFRGIAPGADDCSMWLYQASETSSDISILPCFKANSLPDDQWLLKSERPEVVDVPSVVDMSRYFRKITDDLDQWLARGAVLGARDPTAAQELNERDVQSRLKPSIPTSLDLSWSFGSGMSRSDNPWLLKSSSKSRSISPASSRRSSMTSNKPSNKWLLNGGHSNTPATTQIACPFMEKFKQDAANISWLKSDRQSVKYNANPMACFEAECCDPSQWLKPQKNVQPLHEALSPLKSFIERHKCSSMSEWLCNTAGCTTDVNPPCFDGLLEQGGNKWLMYSLSPFQTNEEMMDEIV